MTNPQGLFLKARAKHIIQADRGACFRITNNQENSMGKMKSLDQAQTEFQALCRRCDELSLRFRDAVSQGERDAINDEWRQAVADRDAAWDELVAAYGGAKIET